MGEIVRLPVRSPAPQDDGTSPDDRYVGSVHIYRTPSGEHYGVADDESMDFSRRREFADGLREVAVFAGFGLTREAEEAGENPCEGKNGLLAALFIYHSGSISVGLSKHSQEIDRENLKWFQERWKDARKMLVEMSKQDRD